MNKPIKAIIFPLATLFLAKPAHALTPLVTCNDCQLNDFWNTAINGANIILGLTGSLSLLFLIYGGVLFLISGGSAEMVTKGKKAIVGAAIGMLIVFGSWTIIKQVLVTLNPDNANWSGGNVVVPSTE